MVNNKHSLFRAVIFLPILGVLNTGYAVGKSDKLVDEIEQDLLRVVTLLGEKQGTDSKQRKLIDPKENYGIQFVANKMGLQSKPESSEIDLNDLEGLDLSQFIKRPAVPNKSSKSIKKAGKKNQTKSLKISQDTYRRLMLSTRSRSSYRPCYKFNYQELQHRSRKYQRSITEASRRHGVNENLIKSVITAESCFKTRARSRKGARGLMQLMPATARRFGVRNSYDSHQNISAGTEYLRWLLNRFNGNVYLALAGYNAGEGKVALYGGIPPYKETREYVRRVMGVYRTLHGKSNRSFNDYQGGGLVKTRADYQRKWRQQQRAKRYSSHQSRPLSDRRCLQAVPGHIKRLTNLKRSGRGGRIWRRYYQLRPGEDLVHVMRKTGVHVNAIKRMNHLNSRSTLNAGRKLLVWECRA